MRQLVIALAAARRPKWTLPSDGTVDETAVALAASGKPVRLTRPERDAAARRIISAGGGPSQLSARLHMSGTTAARVYEAVTGHPAGAVQVGLCVHRPREARDQLTPAEEAAARQLVAGGADASEIAARLGLCWYKAREVRDRLATAGGERP